MRYKDDGYIRFERKCDNGDCVRVEIGEHSDVEAVLDALSRFMRGCGYSLHAGAELTFIHPEEDLVDTAKKIEDEDM